MFEKKTGPASWREMGPTPKRKLGWEFSRVSSRWIQGGSGKLVRWAKDQSFGRPSDGESNLPQRIESQGGAGDIGVAHVTRHVYRDQLKDMK